jgi:hypothetical protein
MQCYGLASASCEMFATDDLCQSRCESCGKACEAIIIEGDYHVTQYSVQNCTYVLGSVTIRGLEYFSFEEFDAVFRFVSVINGDLTIENSAGLVTLAAFRRLQAVSSIVIRSNPNLVDARLPSLAAYSSIDCVGNLMLCPARCPVSQIDEAQGECGNVTAVQLLSFVVADAYTMVESIIEQLIADSDMNVSFFGCC